MNGAQTVRSISDAVAADDEAGSAQVGVRIIVTGDADDFAKRTTQATNRQNRVEARDFIALDPVQAAIVEEMKAELGLEYSVRRRELEVDPKVGCSVVDAACALACPHPDTQYAARIATTLDVLWERGGQGIYDVLFRPQPGVYLIWNSVSVFRETRRALHDIRPRYAGRGAAAADHGVYLLAHLMFRQLDTESIDEPDSGPGWLDQALSQVPQLVDELLPKLAVTIDELYGDRSQIAASLSDVGRCREIVDHITGAAAPSATVAHRYRRIPAERKRRRPNAVSVLVDRGLLAEGDALTLVAGSSPEVDALRAWLAANPARERATWVPHRSKPILWAADGDQYSPSGLITLMWELAGWERRPVANQGTTRWKTTSGQTLADLAWRALDEPDSTAEQ